MSHLQDASPTTIFEWDGHWKTQVAITMKLAKIPVANRLQAIETAIDSLSQKHPEIPELAKTLHYIRSVQRTMVGPRYVKEHSLRRCNESPARLKKKSNWAKVQRERAIKQNGRLA